MSLRCFKPTKKKPMPLVTDIKKADAFVILDFHNVVRRAEGAPGPTKEFANQYGFPTGYIYLTLRKVFAILRHYGLNQNQNVCLVVSPQENSARRKKMYPLYKSTRKPREYSVFEVVVNNKMTTRTPDPISDCMELMRCVPCIELVMKTPWETDDAIASFQHQTKKLNKRAMFYIVTEDRDPWCLISKRVKLVSLPGVEYDIDALSKKFVVRRPSMLPLAKALFGDGSDCIKKAVRGITETNIPTDLLENARRRKGESYGECLYRIARRYLKDNRKQKDTKQYKQVQKLADKSVIAAVDELVNVIRLRKNLKLMLVKHAGDPKKIVKLIDWLELKSCRDDALAMSLGFQQVKRPTRQKLTAKDGKTRRSLID